VGVGWLVVAVAGWPVADFDGMKMRVKLATEVLKDGETFTVTFRRCSKDAAGMEKVAPAQVQHAPERPPAPPVQAQVEAQAQVQAQRALLQEHVQMQPRPCTELRQDTSTCPAQARAQAVDATGNDANQILPQHQQPQLRHSSGEGKGETPCAIDPTTDIDADKCQTFPQHQQPQQRHSSKEGKHEQADFTLNFTSGPLGMHFLGGRLLVVEINEDSQVRGCWLLATDH
jgi:hypothetical protein